jgi:very-short-patch-repair endonuclease
MGILRRQGYANPATGNSNSIRSKTERDVIFISVGYGRDGDGHLRMNFGPLQTSGGERRLNVLITRAKRRCEVFSSITADDIDLSRAQSAGARALKAFLGFAEKGVFDSTSLTDRDFDSEFERHVHDELVRRGYNVSKQVGVAGFFIDLAISDPKHPGRYVLGIECDGATYHSSRSARDRDRLREELLRDRGWKLHRIWSTDWFHRPQEQLQRAIEAIELALRNSQSREKLNGSQSV